MDERGIKDWAHEASTSELVAVVAITAVRNANLLFVAEFEQQRYLAAMAELDLRIPRRRA